MTAKVGRFHFFDFLVAGFMKPLRLTKAGLSDYCMHLLYALVSKSSFSKAQGFIKPAPGQQRRRTNAVNKLPQSISISRWSAVNWPYERTNSNTDFLTPATSEARKTVMMLLPVFPVYLNDSP